MLTARRLRSFPFTSALFGPPRRTTTVEQIASAAGIARQEVRPEEALPDPAPAWFGPRSPYLPPPAPKRPAISVYQVAGARVLGPDGHVVVRGDHLILDTLWENGESPGLENRPVMQRRKRYPSVRLRGRTALLASDWSIGGFGHFLTDALPRWWLFEKAGMGAGSFDQVLAYHPRTETTRALLARLPAGLSIIHAEPLQDYLCDSLAFTGFPHLAPRFTPEPLRWVRDLYPPVAATRRVYLSRDGFIRHPTNAKEIEGLLASRGFETIPSRDHAGAVEAARAASVVIGVEGANLFNTLFSSERTPVIELRCPSTTVPYVACLGATLGRPTAIVGFTPGSRPEAPTYGLADIAAALDWAT